MLERATTSPPSTVTVVIPCYNYARYLPQAVNSALSQRGVAVDVVVVNDCSTDDSLDVAHALAAEDPRISVIANEENAGPVMTFNRGLAVASGEFLVRLDADDLLTPGSLSRAVRVFLSNPPVGLVYGHPLHFRGSNVPAARERVRGVKIWPGRAWLRDRCRSGFNVITSPEVVMRKSVVDAVGGQQPLAHTHDMEMWLRIAAFADVAYLEGADQAWHREHDASLSARKVDDKRDLDERRLAFETLFAGVAGEIPEADELRALSMRSVAESALQLLIGAYDRNRVDANLVSSILETARKAVPHLENLPSWNQLQARMRMGPAAASRHPAFVLSRLLRKVRSELSWRRWHRHGVF